MADASYDVVIVGSGPGGYVAAIRASQLGLKTAIVERERLGGICLNWGCIPTKALLRVSELRHTLERLGDFGITAGEVSVDIEKVVAYSRKVADQLSRGVAYLMKKNGITVLKGQGRLAGSGALAGDEGGRRGPRRSVPPTSSSPPARGRGCCPGWNPTARRSGPTRRRWCPPRIRRRCW